MTFIYFLLDILEYFQAFWSNKNMVFGTTVLQLREQLPRQIYLILLVSVAYIVLHIYRARKMFFWEGIVRLGLVRLG